MPAARFLSDNQRSTDLPAMSHSAGPHSTCLLSLYTTLVCIVAVHSLCVEIGMCTCVDSNSLFTHVFKYIWEDNCI